MSAHIALDWSWQSFHEFLWQGSFTFPEALKRQTQHITELTSMASAPYALLRRWIRPDSSTLRNSNTVLCLVRTSTTSAILHSCCVESMCLTGALLILVKLDSDAIWRPNV
jgi:hypothetical protein